MNLRLSLRAFFWCCRILVALLLAVMLPIVIAFSGGRLNFLDALYLLTQVFSFGGFVLFPRADLLDAPGRRFLLVLYMFGVVGALANFAYMLIRENAGDSAFSMLGTSAVVLAVAASEVWIYSRLTREKGFAFDG